jgi:transposase-like protein
MDLGYARVGTREQDLTGQVDAGDAVVDVARTFGVDRATLYRMRAETGMGRLLAG